MLYKGILFNKKKINEKEQAEARSSHKTRIHTEKKTHFLSVPKLITLSKGSMSQHTYIIQNCHL